MKKLLFTLLILGLFNVNLALAAHIEGILDNCQAVYSPSANVWSTGSMVEDKIVFTKKTSAGTGSFSTFMYKDGEINLCSNYEFVFDSRLICVDNENLKYYELVYNDGNFEQKLLTEEEIQKIFSDTDVVKISEFKDGLYTILSNGTSKKVLLLNDTDLNFHKYFISPCKYNVNNNIKGLIQLPKRGKVKFQHLSEGLQPIYTIKVR